MNLFGIKRNQYLRRCAHSCSIFLALCLLQAIYGSRSWHRVYYAAALLFPPKIWISLLHIYCFRRLELQLLESATPNGSTMRFWPAEADKVALAVPA